MKASPTNTSIKLFEGERALVITGIVGFILSGCIAIYLFFQGPFISPEGNMKDAFSFNAAIGIFILSIAAILPFSGYEVGKRKVIRWFFIVVSLYSYAVETIQNLRGFNPRFSREGTVIDTVAGMLFGVVSLVLVVLTIMLTIHFLRIKKPFQRPLMTLGIRYAFLSVLASNSAGLWMILLQDRFTGSDGNIIILHGIGFHALQTLLIPSWLLEKTNINGEVKRSLIHIGSIAWMLMVLLIAIQTAMGQTILELTALPILAGFLFLVWVGTVMIPFVLLVKQTKKVLFVKSHFSKSN